MLGEVEFNAGMLWPELDTLSSLIVKFIVMPQPSCLHEFNILHQHRISQYL